MMADILVIALQLRNKEKKVLSKNARATANKYSFNNVKKEYLQFITKELKEKNKNTKIAKK